MIIVRDDGSFNDTLLDIEIARLESLVSDLERLRDGGVPAAEEIAAAPIIDQWEVAMRSEAALIGLIQGHPRGLSMLRPSVTSGLWIIDPVRGYARTLSRIYALGLRRGEHAGSIQ
ncbi:hypothetical protein [Microvirga makkahensis]|uniref:Uncharacterized protein n=1 Tax=Microvirga makkahensis TaxID=1128670 RepID=A0A7X3MNP9_9HYPH|nr:hypothetical protein [Microvirga makkahensis]MXQ10451.1 hypothetical protein [Microvirga makkahensis]